MNIKPLADRILIRPKKVEEKTAGGIYLPETASKEKPVKGEVVAVGPGKLDNKGKRVALEVKEGDTVIYSKWAGTEIKVEGENFLLMKEDDVLAIA